MAAVFQPTDRAAITRAGHLEDCSCNNAKFNGSALPARETVVERIATTLLRTTRHDRRTTEDDHMKTLSSCNWLVLAVAASSVLTASLNVFDEPAENAQQADARAMRRDSKPVPRWGDACPQGGAADCVRLKHH
jgi:hypothetical protein